VPTREHEGCEGEGRQRPSEHGITAATGLIALLGHPVGHSLSPRMHNAAFRAQGLDLVYLAFDVEPVNLPVAVAAMRALGVRGANVTVPHKEAIMPLLDHLAPAAARVGAVNTVVNRNGRLEGYNTDLAGFSQALRLLLPEGAGGRRCLVVGAGGAARAVVAALMEDGAARISICNRTFRRAVDLCQAASTWGSAQCEALPWAEVGEGVEKAEIVVNATPVGLSTAVKDLALPVDKLHSGHVLVDLVYGRETTALVRAAQARGARAVDGKPMLVFQAAQSYLLWTGHQPPLEVMWECVQDERRG